MIATSSIQTINNLSVITQYSELTAYGTTTPAYTQQTYYHVPFIAWIIIAVPFFFVLNRLLIEFIIRWRKK